MAHSLIKKILGSVLDPYLHAVYHKDICLKTHMNSSANAHFYFIFDSVSYIWRTIKLQEY